MTHWGLLVLGLVATAGGAITLVALAVFGVLAHPEEAATAYGPLEFLVIGGSLLAILIGVVVTFRSVVPLPEPERR